MTKQQSRKASDGPQVTAFINPGPKVTLRLPGERNGKPMANKSTARKATAAKPKTAAQKANGKRARSRGKVNGARAASPQQNYSRPAAKRAAPAAKANPHKKRKKGHKNPGWGFRNPLGAIGNVSIMEWLAFGGTAILTNAVTSLVANPSSWTGIGIQAGITFGVGKLAPRSVKTAATFGAGGAAVTSLINRFTNNAIPNFIQTNLRALIPGQQQVVAQQLAPAPAASGQMAGYRGVQRGGMNGIITVPPGSVLYSRVS